MAISHVVLTKGARKVILGGSRHYGSESDRLAIQKNIDEARQDDFLFFREGLSVRRAKPKKIKYKLIIYFIELLVELGKMRTKIRGQLAIEKKLEFSNNLVIVDKNEEFLQELNEYGFVRYWPLLILFHASLILARYWLGFLSVSIILSDFIIDRTSPIFMDARDKLVVQAIEEDSASKIYVHYGNSHIIGMRKLLIQEGWQVEKETLIIYPEPLKFREVWNMALEQTRNMLRYYVERYAWMLDDRRK